MTLENTIALLILLLGLRTALWHLQSWQLREYRTDRMRAWLNTKDGKKAFFNLWFFGGLLPRPKITGRVCIIFFIFLLLSAGMLFGLLITVVNCAFIPQCGQFLPAFGVEIIIALIWERTIWFTMGLAVMISKIPVVYREKQLYRQAKKIIAQSESVTRIGISGSYGKSSTKEILIHLLQSHFGKENVLYNPENQNNSIAVARLILKNKSFFKPSLSYPLPKGEEEVSGNKGGKKFLVIEISAYGKGFIEEVCGFIQPHIGILTGVNAQHMDLFGSQKAIQEAKFELAENTSDKIIFNADNDLLNEIFADREIEATKIPIATSVIHKLKSEPNHSTFEVYGEKYTLPWGGEFFVQNAMLAMEVARECGLNPKDMIKYLKNLKPLKRALKVEKHKSGAIIMKDLYSANPDGVISAINHLGKIKGQKIFVGIPLRELGGKASESHEQIFSSLKEIDAEVFWLKTDYADLGLQICGKRFQGQDTKKLKNMIKDLGKNDAVLLESRLPKEVVAMFEN